MFKAVTQVKTLHLAIINETYAPTLDKTSEHKVDANMAMISQRLLPGAIQLSAI